MRGRSSFPGEAGPGLRPYGWYPLARGRGSRLGAEFAEAVEGLRGPHTFPEGRVSISATALSVEIPALWAEPPAPGRGRVLVVIRGCVRRKDNLWSDPVRASWKQELMTPLDAAHRAEEAGLTAGWAGHWYGPVLGGANKGAGHWFRDSELAGAWLVALMGGASESSRGHWAGVSGRGSELPGTCW